MQPAIKKKVNPIKWLITYVRESKEEMKKVTWPSKKETVTYSVIVIIISIILAAFFGGLDWLLNIGLEQLIALTA
jgi:preprotein translocase subunit SecE